MPSVCIYASLFCLAWDLRWFSKRPRTPVSAAGCCSPLNGGSSSLPALPVNESIKELTDSRQDPLHHSPWCWNELWSLVWGEGPSPVWLFFFFFFQYYWDFLHLRQPSVSVSDEFAEHCSSFSPRGQGSGVKTTHLCFRVICFKNPSSHCLSSTDVKWVISSFFGAPALNVPSLVCSLTCKDLELDEGISQLKSFAE